MKLSWKQIGLVVGIVTALAAGTWMAVDDSPVMTPDPSKHFRGDITKCKKYTCHAACGETPYTHGVCVDGSNQSAITIECCCCTGENVKNRYFIGG